ncbi:hypothetical protein BC829DRAFT_396815 [Chytridium lagenaria]|nr:hypothetical protein BC829DRAFT_396815 [Chytridium lagenaria]
MNQAAMRGHLDIVKFLHEHRSEGCTTHGIDSAARNGHLDIIRFLHENRSEGCTTSAMDNAAGYGHFEIVKFLHYSRRFLEIVKFLSEINSKGNRIKEL